MNERNPKLVASCRSLYEAKLFLKKCDDLGYHWKDGTKFPEMSIGIYIKNAHVTTSSKEHSVTLRII